MPRIKINEQWHEVASGTSVAAALMNLNLPPRKSILGEPRNPVCGMGICLECRVTINGKPHQRGCQVEAAEGMEVLTDAV